MKTSIYSRHRFHPDIIQRAIWMYFRFNLSFRDVEELMIERGIDVSYETIRRWVEKFGSQYAKRIKSRSENPSPVWHLDEVYTKINSKMVYLWRAVDDEGTVLDIVVQQRRNTKAAKRLLRKLLKKPGHQAYSYSYGQACFLRSGSQGFRPKTSTRCRREKKQSRRMLPRSDTKARTKSTEVQIYEECSKATFSPRSNLQSLQSSTPSHLKKYPSKIQSSSANRMERCDRFSMRIKSQFGKNSGSVS